MPSTWLRDVHVTKWDRCSDVHSYAHVASTCLRGFQMVMRRLRGHIRIMSPYAVHVGTCKLRRHVKFKWPRGIRVAMYRARGHVKSRWLREVKVATWRVRGHIRTMSPRS
eukprot:5062227-Karenia_brevis.AAC.1